MAEGKGNVTGGGAEVGGGEAVGDGGKGGGEGGGPSRLRLPKDGRGSLPRDMTRRSPVHNVLFGQFFFLSTERSETCRKISWIYCH